MPLKSWNKFVDAYPSAPACVTKVSPSLPKAARILDKKGRALPTPYSLLKEWLSENLKGDWSSMTRGGLVLVRVSEKSDLDQIKGKFGLIAGPQKSDASPETYQFGYSDQGYGQLALDLGYNIN